MLADQARKSHETLGALVAFMDNPTKEMGQKVSSFEKEADAKRLKLVEALNLSFVTPIDREDIHELSRAVDDMADYAKTTVAEMTLFEVGPNPHLREMAVAMENGARLLWEALLMLPKASRSNGSIGELIVKIKKLENYIEKIYRQALRELFASQDVIGILKTREIFRHLSNAADRMDHAADVLGNILMKTT